MFILPVLTFMRSLMSSMTCRLAFGGRVPVRQSSWNRSNSATYSWAGAVGDAGSALLGELELRTGKKGGTPCLTYLGQLRAHKTALHLVLPLKWR